MMILEKICSEKSFSCAGLKDLMRITVHDFFELYESVMEIQRDRLGEDKDWEGEISRVRHPCLKPRLRPYQRESVAWMLRQEEGGGNNVAKDNQYGTGIFVDFPFAFSFTKEKRIWSLSCNDEG